MRFDSRFRYTIFFKLPFCKRYLRIGTPFHYTIRFKSIKQMLDWEESRWFRIFARLGWFNPSYFSPIGYSLQLTKPEDFVDSQIKRSLCGNMKPICEYSKQNLGKTAIDHRGNHCIFEGLEITQDDYYYILKDENGRVIYENCNCAISIIE